MLPAAHLTPLILKEPLTGCSIFEPVWRSGSELVSDGSTGISRTALELRTMSGLPGSGDWMIAMPVKASGWR